MGNKSSGTNVWTAIIVIAVLIFIGLVITGKIDITRILETERVIIKEPTTLTPAPTEITDCSEISIANEFNKYFTVSTMDSFEDACDVNGGTWTESGNEVSCYWNPAVGSIDCNQDAIKNYFKPFCKDTLKANWLCDNSIAYVGCYCLGSKPEDWDESQDGYTCGWTGSICTGTCPDTHPICEEIDWDSGDTTCACLTSDYEEVHPDWKPDGPYYNPHQDELELPKWRIFVTSIKWNGAMGTLTGMDEKCQTTAYYAGLGGNWIALASNNGEDARSRILNGEYIRMDGVTIATEIPDLFDGTIDVPINLNEKYELTEGLVWTGTNWDGWRAGLHCNNWQWVAEEGKYGASGASNQNWIDAGVRDCDLYAHIYCIEMLPV